MDYLVEDEVLFPQVRHAILSFAPLIFPEVHCQCLVLRVQQSLSMSHLEDFVDSLFFDLHLLIGFVLSKLDLLVSYMVRLVQSLALLEVRLL